MEYKGLTREEFYNLPVATFYRVQNFLFIDQNGDSRFYYVDSVQDYGVARHILMLDRVDSNQSRSITDPTDIVDFTTIYPQIKN